MTKQTETVEGGEGAAGSKPGTQGVNIRLVPSDGSDQPAYANLTLINPASGVAIVDFGFMEPAAFAQVSRLMRAGKKVPERLNGRLAVRVALGYDTLAQFHQQIGQVLQAVSRAAQEARKKGAAEPKPS
jgi:hypothetical protein